MMQTAVRTINDFARERARLYIEYILIGLVVAGSSLTFTLWNEKRVLAHSLPQQEVYIVACPR